MRNKHETSHGKLLISANEVRAGNSLYALFLIYLRLMPNGYKNADYNKMFEITSEFSSAIDQQKFKFRDITLDNGFNGKEALRTYSELEYTRAGSVRWYHSLTPGRYKVSSECQSQSPQLYDSGCIDDSCVPCKRGRRR